MALQMNYTKWGNTWTNAYFYIQSMDNMDRVKKQITMKVSIFTDSNKVAPPIDCLEYQFVKDANAQGFPLFDDWFANAHIEPLGQNIYERGYTYLQTLPEYSTAVPV